MKTLYLDCISGIAGDMTLSALIDLGADIDYIKENLRKLPIDEFKMSVEKTMKCGIASKKLKLEFDGSHHHQHHHEHHHDNDHHHEHGLHHHEHHHEHDHHRHEHHHEHGLHHHEHHHEHDHHRHEHHHEHGLHHHEHHHEHGHHHHEHHHEHDHHHRNAGDIIRMIHESTLPLRVKQRSISILTVIAEAEGKIHDMEPNKVHFHEVGAMDSIIDIIGVCLALENLDIDEIYASPVPTGQGKVWMAHGFFPIPAPATAELLIGIPLAELEAKGELITPTGAGILKALVKQFGPLPAAKIERIGYGAGEKDFNHPNVVRAFLLNLASKSTKESIIVLETQIDDMTGEAFGYTMDRLFEAGALDVFYTPIFMKKNRPGTLITVLCSNETSEKCEAILLNETTTLGVRQSTWGRRILERRFITLDTPYGEIRMKQGMSKDKVIHQAPEYEDIARAAKLYGIPFHEIYQSVLKML
ncbi:nickel pincer cofactor biosynthesis protein LarC [Neobacillus cucumis]|uniref:nickel pincer cofactor biosynthesis protein LarC n=1 Tax=Neobacillus cucumis TaxID=1740721 RepID=UPI002E24AD8B|nr:nickel pincer cofactor biosynthesis protein LarC [Neobacillus cucumis]